MRKTLTLVAVVLAAGSLAACKPFWQKEPPPAPTAAAVEPTTTVETPMPVTPTDPAKPADQTAPTEAGKTISVEKTPAPATPAAK
jgi:hypothetical protein